MKLSQTLIEEFNQKVTDKQKLLTQNEDIICNKLKYSNFFDKRQRNSEFTNTENIIQFDSDNTLKNINIEEWISSFKKELTKELEEIKKRMNEIEEIRHWAKSSWDEWNWRKEVFGTPKMEEIYGKKH